MFVLKNIFEEFKITNVENLYLKCYIDLFVFASPYGTILNGPFAQPFGPPHLGPFRDPFLFPVIPPVLI